ncbi:hypothetical protein ABVK25_009963 [Lepraria finkii]|uniref:Uncharacterized protein n=1 Tax=Lepraria finkii TaxID=1340010 RepID=A0ABR4AWT9_9LECA
MPPLLVTSVRLDNRYKPSFIHSSSRIIPPLPAPAFPPILINLHHLLPHNPQTRTALSGAIIPPTPSRTGIRVSPRCTSSRQPRIIHHHHFLLEMHIIARLPRRDDYRPALPRRRRDGLDRMARESGTV